MAVFIYVVAVLIYCLHININTANLFLSLTSFITSIHVSFMTNCLIVYSDLGV
jgi:putative flippase GtrA